MTDPFESNYAAAMDRQRDSAHQAMSLLLIDQRMITGVLATQLLAADDPEKFAGLSTSAVIPSTIPHPVQVPK